MLGAFCVVGCNTNQPGAVGPHRIHAQGAYGPETYYARLTPKSEIRNVMLFTGKPYRELQFTDAVTGERKNFISTEAPIPYTLVKMDDAAYEKEVREAREPIARMERERREAQFKASTYGR